LWKVDHSGNAVVKTLVLSLDAQESHGCVGESRTYRLPPINSPTDNRPYIHCGYVQFSDIGVSLSRIAGAKLIAGFFDYLESEWKKKNMIRETTR
jgi:hypothetical protein